MGVGSALKLLVRSDEYRLFGERACKYMQTQTASVLACTCLTLSAAAPVACCAWERARYAIFMRAPRVYPRVGTARTKFETEVSRLAPQHRTRCACTRAAPAVWSECPRAKIVLQAGSLIE